MRTFELLFAAPIPVGNRVEVSLYEEERAGLFATRTVIHVQVRDLATGIVFGPHELYWEGIGIRFGDRLALLDSPRQDLGLKERIEGRVAACRVATVQLNDASQVQTTLTLEE